MADFGKAGKLTWRTESTGGGVVNVSAGEHVAFKIIVAGGDAQFEFATNGRILWNQDSFPGHPTDVYMRDWPQHAQEIDPSQDYILVFGFLDAPIKYRITVERQNREHQHIETWADFDGESSSNSDDFPLELIITVR